MVCGLVGPLLTLLLLATLPAAAQQGKREVALPQPGRLRGQAMLLGSGATLFGADPAARSWDNIITTFDGEYRQFRPRPETPPEVARLYATEFDGLRHRELRPGSPDTTRYGINLDIIHPLTRAATGEWRFADGVRLPVGANCLGKGPNGDLYFSAIDPRDARSLYRFDPRARRLFRSNLPLPLLHDYQDQWLSAAGWGQSLFLLNDVGNNLVELAPGRPPRNVLAAALKAPQVPGFIGKVMNMTVGPDRTFYLKENFTPTLWNFTEKDGRLTVAPPIQLAYRGVTGGIEVLPGPPGRPPRLLLAQVETVNSSLVEYDLATHTVVSYTPRKCTDLAFAPVTAAAPRPPKSSAATLNGWFRGALYVDYAAQPELALRLRPGGVIDSVAFGERAFAVRWHYLQSGSEVDISTDPAFADYVAWLGGGRSTGAGAAATLTLALQSSTFDGLNDALGAAGPVPFAFSAATEGFAQLRPGPPPAKQPPVAVAPAPDTLVARVTPPPTPSPPPLAPPPADTLRAAAAPKPPKPRVSDSLSCAGGPVVVEVADYNVVDGDQVQFFLDEKPLTGVITLRRKPRRFQFQCPGSGGLLVMKTINAGQGPCTARLVIRQGEYRKEFKLQSQVKRPSGLKFFRR